MIQITPQMRVLVSVEAVDFRKGIDGLARLCRDTLNADAFSGCLFVFRNRSGTAVKILVYDGQGALSAGHARRRAKFRVHFSRDNGRTSMV